MSKKIKRISTYITNNGNSFPSKGFVEYEDGSVKYLINDLEVEKVIKDAKSQNLSKSNYLNYFSEREYQMAQKDVILNWASGSIKSNNKYDTEKKLEKEEDLIDEEITGDNLDEDIDLDEEELEEAKRIKDKKRLSMIGLAATSLFLGGMRKPLVNEYFNNNKEVTNNLNNEDNKILNSLNSDIDWTKEDYDFDTLLQNVSNSTRRKFFKENMDFLNEFHELTHKKDNFYIKEDKTTYLDFTMDEVNALNLMLNDYSNDQLNDILGEHIIDATRLQSDINSAYQKLSTYYINAKEPSGLDKLIQDKNSKEFFKKMETAVINFNKDRTKANATNIIRNAYYNYITTGAAGSYAVNNFDVNKASNAQQAVSFISTSPFMGFTLSTKDNPDYYQVAELDNAKEEKKYGVLYMPNGTKWLRQVNKEIANEHTEENFKNIGPNGETGILNAIDQLGLGQSCSNRASFLSQMSMNAASNYNEYLRFAATDLNTSIQRLNDVSLSEQLMSSLAKKFNNEIIPSELLNKLRSHSMEAKKIADTYDQRVMKYREPQYKELTLKALVKAKQLNEYDAYQKNAVGILTANRVNKLKNKVNENAYQSDEIYYEEEVSVEENEFTEQVEKDKLPDEFKKEANKKEEKIQLEIAKHNATSQATIDAVAFASETGAYKDGQLTVTYPNGEKHTVSDLNLNGYAGLLKSWDMGTIAYRQDEEIRRRMEQDKANFISSLSQAQINGAKNEFGDNWKSGLGQLYENTWYDELEGVINKGLSNIERGSSIKMFNEVQKKLDKINEQAPKKEEIVKPSENNLENQKPKENDDKPKVEDVKIDEDWDQTKDPSEGLEVKDNSKEEKKLENKIKVIEKKEDTTIIKEVNKESPKKTYVEKLTKEEEDALIKYIEKLEEETKKEEQVKQNEVQENPKYIINNNEALSEETMPEKTPGRVR